MGLPYILITVDTSNLNFPLRQIYVGQGSALNLRLSGFDAERFTAAAVVHPLVEGAAPARFNFAESEDGRLECHIQGWSLSVYGVTSYEVLIFDSESDPAGEAYWTGRGKLVVRQAVQTAEVPDVPMVTPPSGYIQHPVTGLWHKVVGDLNDLGQLSLTVDPVGVEHA